MLTNPIYPGGTAVPRTNAGYFNKSKALDLQTVPISNQQKFSETMVRGVHQDPANISH